MVACRDYIQKTAIFRIKCMLRYTTKDMDIPNRKYMNRVFFDMTEGCLPEASTLGRLTKGLPTAETVSHIKICPVWFDDGNWLDRLE
jgi:hypothetical protein